MVCAILLKLPIVLCCQTKARQFETAALHAGGRLDYARKQETELSELRQKQMKLENEVGQKAYSVTVSHRFVRLLEKGSLISRFDAGLTSRRWSCRNCGGNRGSSSVKPNRVTASGSVSLLLLRMGGTTSDITV
jgi:hypothetical protein